MSRSTAVEIAFMREVWQRRPVNPTELINFQRRRWAVCDKKLEDRVSDFLSQTWMTGRKGARRVRAGG